MQDKGVSVAAMQKLSYTGPVVWVIGYSPVELLKTKAAVVLLLNLPNGIAK